jgi:hypothetical protein
MNRKENNMPGRVRLFRLRMFAAAFAAYSGSTAAALASDPLPGDAVAPPPNSNVFLLYDEYQNDDHYGGQPGDPHGPDATDGTKFEVNLLVARYVRTFSLGGFNAGVQVYLPYVTFLGGQTAGINNLGSAAPGLLPSLGRGSIDLSKTSGFAQPSFGAFIFPIADRQNGTYVVVGPWIDPPISSFNKNSNLNPSQNVWTFEAEFAFRTVLFGTPATPNLTFEIWQEDYFYLSNPHSAVPGETISAGNIPPIYYSLGVSNPVRATPAVDARFREQPTTELHVYLPYEPIPAVHFFVAPGLYQAFGGKQTYLADGGVADSSLRTEETQLRLIVSSFVSPTLQVSLAGDYDVAAHGTPYNRTLEIRVVKYF